jgi:hypothetical protein
MEKTDYVSKINALIPIAEAEAKVKVQELGMASEPRPGADGKNYNHCFFSEFFHKAMKRLAMDAGLRSC